MTGQELIDNAAKVLNQTATGSAFITECLFWANAVQDEMYIEGDWAELIVRDAALVANGAKSYDLRTAITSVTDFGRLRDGSVRYGTWPLVSKSVSFIDDNDPDQTNTGDPKYYAMAGYKFIPWPFPGSGSFKLDYIKFPATIAQATVESAISFSPENHVILFQGVLYMGMRRYGTKDWVTQFQIYEGMRNKALKRSGKMKHSPFSITPNPY